MDKELLGEQHYAGMLELNHESGRVALQQIGRMNVLAISGGRVSLDRGALILPVHAGYSVMVQLHGSDTYTVRRIFKRGPKVWVKGTVSDVYFNDLGQVAYYASCYVNVPFGSELQGAVNA